MQFFFTVLYAFIVCTVSVCWGQEIDVVYTWVDSSSPKWQQQQQEAVAASGKEWAFGATAACRFRNRDELKYSLRSIWKFAPFVHHIYIVTSGQIPSWFQPHPAITFVNHDEIFAHKEHLPTFNSHAIEANLHRIPHLKEYFIYFNDDVLLAKEVTASHFFDEKGRMRLVFSQHKSPAGPIEQEDTGWRSGWKNTNAFLNATFKEEARKALRHAPFALRKSVIQEMEKKFSTIFTTVSANKFRSFTDFTMTNGLIPYYAYYTKQAAKGLLQAKTVRLGKDRWKIQQQLKAVAKGQYHAFCLADAYDQHEDAMDPLVIAFLEKKFPEKAPWER